MTRPAATKFRRREPRGPHDHTYLNLGTLYFYGRSVQRFQGQDSTGVSTVLTAREPFYRVGGDFSFNYHAFNLFGQYMYGRDQNLLPLLPAGLPTADRSSPGKSGQLQWRLSGGGLLAPALADDHHALGRSALHCRPYQRHRSHPRLPTSDRSCRRSTPPEIALRPACSF